MNFLKISAILDQIFTLFPFLESVQLLNRTFFQLQTCFTSSPQHPPQVSSTSSIFSIFFHGSDTCEKWGHWWSHENPQFPWFWTTTEKEKIWFQPFNDPNSLPLPLTKNWQVFRIITHLQSNFRINKASTQVMTLVLPSTLFVRVCSTL